MIIIIIFKEIKSENRSMDVTVVINIDRNALLNTCFVGNKIIKTKKKKRSLYVLQRKKS